MRAGANSQLRAASNIFAFDAPYLRKKLSQLVVRLFAFLTKVASKMLCATCHARMVKRNQVYHTLHDVAARRAAAPHEARGAAPLRGFY